MPINVIPQDPRSDEEREQDAIKHMDLLFDFLPLNNGFQVSSIIGQNFKDEAWKTIAKDATAIDKYLRDFGYVEQGSLNLQVRLTKKGEQAKALGGHIFYEQYQTFKNYQFMSPEIQQTCKALFLRHKNSPTPIRWNKEIAREFDPNYQVALACMVEQRIIFKDKEGGVTRTHLNAEYSALNTYEEARLVVEEKKTPKPSVLIKDSFNKNVTASGAGSNAGIGNDFEQKVNHNPEPKAPDKKKWWKEMFDWFLEQIKKPIGIGITALCSGLIGVVISRASCKSQGQVNSPTQYQSPKKQIGKDTSSNKSTILLDSIQRNK